MKILYLSYDGMTDSLGQSQVLPYLSGLSEQGYRFTLVSFEKPDRFEQYQSIVQAACEASNISWIPLKYTKYPPVLSTLLDVVKMLRKVRQLHAEASFAIIHCRSYISSLVGLRMKQKHGIKFLFDMRGFWADERVEGGIWNLRNPLFRFVYRYFKHKEKQFFEEADHIISLTEAGKREITAWPLVGQPRPISVIPCCANLDLFSYEALEEDRRDALRQELNLPESTFLLCYLGSIGTWYMLPEMLTFFRVVKDRIPTAHFLFVTGEDPSMVLEEAGNCGVAQEDLTIRRAHREEVPYFLSLADVGLFFIKPVFSKTASSPTKQGEIMGMGIPIICNDRVGDTGPIIKETGAGIVLSAFDLSAYQVAVDQLSEVVKIPRAKIRAGAMKYYSLKEGVARYFEVYQDLLACES